MNRPQHFRDDTGVEVVVRAPVRHVVSLVPSLTESIAVTAPHLLVAATNWCTHTADVEPLRVGGTKNPDVTAIMELAPDLVLANFEENRTVDLDALRAAGVAVWVTKCTTVVEALTSLARMFRVLGVDRPAWLATAEQVWSLPYLGVRQTAVVPIWRRPWMVLGGDTFAGDLLRLLGVDNAYAAHEERYPRVPIGELRAAAPLVVLPDEPYAFSATDGPEEFGGRSVVLVSGRHLTWYGPSLVEARHVLTEQLGG